MRYQDQRGYQGSRQRESHQNYYHELETVVQGPKLDSLSSFTAESGAVFERKERQSNLVNA